MASAIRRLPIPIAMKCENLSFQSSENGLCKEVQRYISSVEYGDISGIFDFYWISFKIINQRTRCIVMTCHKISLDISDNSTRDNDDLYTIDSQTTSRNSPSVMIETSNDSDIGNNTFPTSNLLSKVL